MECILKIKDSFYSSHIIAIKENTIADLSFNSKSAQCVFESLKQLEDAVTTIIPITNKEKGLELQQFPLKSDSS